MKKIFLSLLCMAGFLFNQITIAQTHSKGPSAIKYISHEIKKSGTGDHGIFKDVYSYKRDYKDIPNVKNIKKQEYQNIHIVLEKGDVLAMNISIYNSQANLFNVVNNHLQPVKINQIDTSISKAEITCFNYCQIQLKRLVIIRFKV